MRNGFLAKDMYENMELRNKACMGDEMHEEISNQMDELLIDWNRKIDGASEWNESTIILILNRGLKKKNLT